MSQQQPAGGEKQSAQYEPIAVTVRPEEITDEHFLLGKFQPQSGATESPGKLLEVTVIKGKSLPENTATEAYKLVGVELPVLSYLKQLGIGQGKNADDIKFGVELRFNDEGRFYNWRSASPPDETQKKGSSARKTGTSKTEQK